jgi:hypothetical protein
MEPSKCAASINIIFFLKLKSPSLFSRSSKERDVAKVEQNHFVIRIVRKFKFMLGNLSIQGPSCFFNTFLKLTKLSFTKPYLCGMFYASTSRPCDLKLKLTRKHNV